MHDALAAAAFYVVLSVAGGRAIAVVIGVGHTLLRRRQFKTFRVGWAELVTWTEAFVLGAATYTLARSAPSRFSGTDLVALVSGAGVVLASVGLLLWAVWSWPRFFTGHAIRHDHQLVSTGAYGLVRHPLYLGSFGIWIGLGLAFRSVTVLALTVLYVIPAYLACIRSEEHMMREEFGEAYREYCAKVPRLVPRVR